jgi:hypothetical protein
VGLEGPSDLRAEKCAQNNECSYGLHLLPLSVSLYASKDQ